MTDQQTPASSPRPTTREQDARDRRIWWALIAAGAVIVLGIMLLMRPLIAGRLDAARQLDQAGTIIAQSNTDIGLIERAAHTELSSEPTSVVLDVERKIPVVRRNLARAVTLVDTGFNHLTDDEQRRATLTRAAASARIAMLDAAPAIVSSIQHADAALQISTQAWNRTVAAAGTEQQAVAAYDLKTTAGLRRSVTLAALAGAEFTAARLQFKEAAAVYPAAKLDVYVTYLDQRLRQLAILKDAIAARQAGNVVRGNALVASYNAAQAKSASLAKALPPTPLQAISDAFRREVAAKIVAFDKALKDATQADTNLKNL